MSSLPRRMQRANARRATQRNGSAGRFQDFGSRIGVRRAERIKPVAKGRRRGKRNKAYIARRKALAEAQP